VSEKDTIDSLAVDLFVSVSFGTFQLFCMSPGPAVSSKEGSPSAAGAASSTTSPASAATRIRRTMGGRGAMPGLLASAVPPTGRAPEPSAVRAFAHAVAGRVRSIGRSPDALVRHR
jgi:hypothetical protein